MRQQLQTYILVTITTTMAVLLHLCVLLSKI